MRNNNYLPRATFESAWANIQKLTKVIETMKEESVLAEKRMDKWIEKADLDRQRIDDSIKAMHQELGGITKSNGEVAESYFVNSFSKSMQFAGQEYDEIDHNLKRKSKKLNLQSEYDLVMYNGASVVIIEIKYKAREKDVERLLKKAPVFKQLHPQYLNYDLYLGLAAFHFEAYAENISINQGIAIIKQIGENMVIYDDHLKVF